VESGLDRLIISIDGTTQNVYQQYRVGGQLDKVIEGTKNIIKWKKELKSKKPFVVFQFLVVKPNEHQIEDVKKMAKEIGVNDVWLKTAQVYDFKNDPNNLIPANDKYSRYRKNTDGYEFKGKLANHCWRLWHDPVITWDGLVAPCCFDKDAQHQLGDLKKNTFKEIWKNGKYTTFRKQILKGRKNINICSNCSEGTKVWER
jgi:radical SAM protein with 4Fe4S-binding SPASM domain